jgi:hypothetical protein
MPLLPRLVITEAAAAEQFAALLAAGLTASSIIGGKLDGLAEKPARISLSGGGWCSVAGPCRHGWR